MNFTPFTEKSEFLILHLKKMEIKNKFTCFLLILMTLYIIVAKDNKMNIIMVAKSQLDGMAARGKSRNMLF